jgi:iron complex outermembrane receptor protein
MKTLRSFTPQVRSPGSPVGAVALNGPSEGEARAVGRNRPCQVEARGHPVRLQIPGFAPLAPFGVIVSAGLKRSGLIGKARRKVAPYEAAFAHCRAGALALLGFGLALFPVGLSAEATALVAAEETTGKTARELADLSIEELMNETVTSVSKREQRLSDAAAAIAVISQDDLRRSGAVTIPDALRLVPGVNVNGINARQSAVSARGFNGVFSHKLLVLVDGRTAYTPLFSGVYWDLQQTMLEDVDRIEVIRGPGATIWGANAVNGVINVVTASARDTQGSLVYAGGGDVHRALAGWRYGGRIGEGTYYRVFASYQTNADWEQTSGAPDRSHWQGRYGGFRVDHYPDADSHLTWQADATRVASIDVDGDNFNTLARWTRQLAPQSSLEVQAYYDRIDRDETNRSRSVIEVFDFSAEQAFTLGERHQVIWGGGYRFVANDVKQASVFAAVRDGLFNRQLLSAFVQDEWQAVPDRLILTAGLKFEHNDITGVELQPSVRAVFKPAETRTVWAAISRAVRTPDEVESHDLFNIIVGGPFRGPDQRIYFPALVGNPALRSEVLWAYELGYRSQPVPRLAVDLAGYYHDYTRLISFGSPRNLVVGQPFNILELPWQNIHDGYSYGGEAAVTSSPTDRWRLTLGYTYARLRVPGLTVLASEIARPPPRHQASLRSAHDLGRRTSFDAQLRYVDDVLTVRAYFTADLRLAYRPRDGLELSLAGQNLFDPNHPEQETASSVVTAEVPRGYYGKLTWRF